MQRVDTGAEVAPRPASWRATAPSLLILASLALVPLLAVLGPEGYILNIAMRIMVLAIAAIALDLLIGDAGLVSFGHAAFLGLGAYTTGIMVTEGLTEAAFILPAVIASSALFALATGALALRTSGVYFIMITLAFGQMLFFAASSLAAYGGDDGLTLWDDVELLGTPVLAEPRSLFYAILAVLIGTFLFKDVVARSRFGRVLRAAKANPERTRALGFDIFAFRLGAYVIAGVIAGIAGFLATLQTEFVSPATMSWQRSGELIVMVVLGGLGTRNGALLGATAFVGIEIWLSAYIDAWPLVFGPLLILVVLYAKGGLASLLRPLTGERSHG